MDEPKAQVIPPVNGKYHIPPHLHGAGQEAITLQFEHPAPDPSKWKVRHPSMPNDLPKMAGNPPEPITWFNIFKITDADGNPVEKTPPYTITLKLPDDWNLWYYNDVEVVALPYTRDSSDKKKVIAKMEIGDPPIGGTRPPTLADTEDDPKKK